MPVGADRFGERAFLRGDRFAGAHEFDVRDADVGNDGDVRRREFRQSGDLARMIHPDFPDGDFVFRVCRQHGAGQADVIVEIAFRLGDAKLPRQGRRHKILGAGLAVAAGDRDHFQRQGRAVVRGQRLITDQGVGDADQGEAGRRRALPILLDHGPGRAALDRLLDKLVAVEVVAAQRDEQIARLKRARVRADPRDRCLRIPGGERSAGKFRDLAK